MRFIYTDIKFLLPCTTCNIYIIMPRIDIILFVFSVTHNFFSNSKTSFPPDETNNHYENNKVSIGRISETITTVFAAASLAYIGPRHYRSR